jgi:hypothetical protein
MENRQEYVIRGKPFLFFLPSFRISMTEVLKHAMRKREVEKSQGKIFKLRNTGEIRYYV